MKKMLALVCSLAVLSTLTACAASSGSSSASSAAGSPSIPLPSSSPSSSASASTEAPPSLSTGGPGSVSIAGSQTGPTGTPGQNGGTPQAGPPPAGSDNSRVPPPPTVSGAQPSTAPFDIDFDALNADWETEMKKADGKLESAQVQASGPMITLVAVVKEGYSEKDLDSLMTKMLSTYNDLARQQDSAITASKSGNYGGLYDKYVVTVGITTKKNLDSQDKWMLNEMVSSSAY